jgi:catalase
MASDTEFDTGLGKGEIVHARGSAAHGYHESLADITKADRFQRAGERIPVFTRFSTVAGGAGSVDTPRDVRVFAGSFIPRREIGISWETTFFFIQDAIKFPDLIHRPRWRRTAAFHRPRPRTTRFGISSA